MHPKLIEAVEERYRGGDQTAVMRAKIAGTFELILVSLGQHHLLQEILETLQSLSDRRGSQ
jgi:hypothetical protein